VLLLSLSHILANHNGYVFAIVLGPNRVSKANNLSEMTRHFVLALEGKDARCLKGNEENNNTAYDQF